MVGNCTFCAWKDDCMESWRSMACRDWKPDRERLDREKDESIRRRWKAEKKRERRQARQDIDRCRETAVTASAANETG